MPDRTAQFRVSEQVIGNRAWCAFSTHGSTGRAINDPTTTYANFAALTNLKGQPGPLVMVKAHHPDEQDPNYHDPVDEDIAAQFTAARSVGYRTLLQVVQLKFNDPNPEETTADAAARVDAHIRAIGVANIDYLSVGNELDIDGNLASSQARAEWVRDVLVALIPLAAVATAYEIPPIVVGQVSSYSQLLKDLQELRREVLENPSLVSLRFAAVSTHEYLILPQLALRDHGLHLAVEELLGLPVWNTETDYGFTGGYEPFGFRDKPHAVYALLNNLEHSYHGIPALDFTLKNEAAVVGVGNGIYQADGTANVDAQAWEDVMGTFLAQPLVEVSWPDFKDYPGLSVYANEAREVVLINYPGDRSEDLDKYFSYALRGRDGAHYVEAEILAYLRFEGPEPSSTPPQARLDWPKFRRRAWAVYHADAAFDLEVLFDDEPLGFTEIHRIETAGEVSWEHGSDGLRVTLPPFSALYLRGTM